MTPTQRKIAIVGLGSAARQIHLPAYKKIAELELVGGYDPVIQANNNNFSFPVYNSLLELIEKTRPDILAVVTPTSYHFELVKTGLENGCHVLCEKPFTTTLQEASELITLSERLGRWIVVNNQFRFMNIYQAAKDKIGSPDFGDLLFLSAQQTFYTSETTETGWRGEDLQRTCKEFGIHVLDLCRYFFAEEPQKISARMPKPENPDGPDFLNLIQLDFSGGRTAHIVLDRLTRGRHRYLDLRLDGTRAAIETEFGGNIEFNAGIRGGDRKPYIGFDITLGGRAYHYQGEKAKKITSDPLDVFANATGKLVKDFLLALECNTIPECCAQDNIKTLALMLAAYESDKRGQPISFAERWK